MANLFGKSYTRGELMERVGDISQVGGVRIGELSDGFERGMRAADIRTGSGLAFTVLPDRGMDIAWADFRGMPLAWRSPAPFAAPAYYEPEGLGWLRGFGGGLLVTCGLTHHGPPDTDGGETMGLHGRVSYIPATHLRYGGDWAGDDYALWVEGQMRDAAVHNGNLVLRRRISALLGESRLWIDDEVTNEGYEPAPLMLLYHCNFGFPLVSEETELLIRSVATPRDAAAEPGLADHFRFQAPTPGYREQVFIHRPHPGVDGTAAAALVNRGLNDGEGLGAYIRFPSHALPFLTEWKMMGRGHYVCGVEPGTNPPLGRPAERAAGRLRMLAPMESARFRLEIGVLASRAEIDAFAASLEG